MIEILGAIIISIFAVLLAAFGAGIVCDGSKRSKSVSNDAIIDESRSSYKDTNDAANQSTYQETHDLQKKAISLRLIYGRAVRHRIWNQRQI